MLIDAKRRFAKRTAKWLLGQRLKKEEVKERLTSVFSNDHIQAIGEEARKLKGLPPRQ
jgi:hypothetical protein